MNNILELNLSKINFFSLGFCNFLYWNCNLFNYLEKFYFYRAYASASASASASSVCACLSWYAKSSIMLLRFSSYNNWFSFK